MEALIYPPIAKGYVTLQGLADGSVSMQTFAEARRLVRFEKWLRDTTTKKATDEVEYFD